MEAIVKLSLVWMLVASLVDAAPTDSNQENRQYSLVRAFPDTRSQVDFLHKQRYQKKSGIEFWKPADWPGRHADIWVSNTTQTPFTDLLKKENIFYKVRVNNWNASDEDVIMENIDHFDRKYQSFEEITSELKRLAKGYSEKVNIIEIGKSFYNKSIYGIQILKQSARKKPLIFFMCGIHGREWLAIASCMYVVRMMIFNDEYENDLQIITNHFEVVFVPVLNPDGYIHTRTKGGRFWRKTRSKTRDKSCPGVDLNRNFSFRWGGGGASIDICDETYCGPRPFSESETRAVASYLYKRRNDLTVFVDVHTYGQLLSHPWGFTRQSSFHQQRQRNALGNISRRIFHATGKHYNYGQTSSILYETAGDSTDWVYGFLGVVHSYGVELMPRLTDRRSLAGFRQHKKNIIPSGRVLFIVLSELAKNSLTELGLTS